MNPRSRPTEWSGAEESDTRDKVSRSSIWGYKAETRQEKGSGKAGGSEAEARKKQA